MPELSVKDELRGRGGGRGPHDGQHMESAGEGAGQPTAARSGPAGSGHGSVWRGSNGPAGWPWWRPAVASTEPAAGLHGAAEPFTHGHSRLSAVPQDAEVFPALRSELHS